MPTIARPAPDEYASFYAGYIAEFPADVDPRQALDQQSERFEHLLAKLPEERAAHRYAPGKWSVREVLGHIADGERIFAYRLLRIARGDTTPLPGFDEDAYAREAGFEGRPFADVLDEWRAVRAATRALVLGLAPATWTRRGVANGQPVSARALLYVMLGHADHHRQVLESRYGLGGA